MESDRLRRHAAPVHSIDASRGETVAAGSVGGAIPKEIVNARQTSYARPADSEDG